VYSRTLSLYFARHFAKVVSSLFLMTLFVISLTTMVEFANRALRGDAALGIQLAVLSLLRVPSITEDTLPFIVLYGSIAAFVVANRRLEVVVARAAGVSAWQFLLPACVVGLLFGLAATLAYNPLAAELLARSNRLVSEVFVQAKPQADQGDLPVWIRQTGGGHDSIVGARRSFDGGLGLTGVTAYVFAPDGTFRERVDAPRGHYAAGEWQLEEATVTAPHATPTRVALYRLPTDLSASAVRQTFQQVDSVSFWTLPGLAESARQAGVPDDRYVLQYHALLARPILLLAMVLIAAIVSLRFSRARRIGPLIMAGVVAGFMLYVVMNVARELGSGGIVPPPLAAWIPATVAILVGITVLLHLEDG
jgi:lipopolysaccharide export system permease protein